MGYIEDLRKLVGHRRVILCGSSVVIRNEKGELLLQQRRHPSGRWAFPGGLMELGESTEDTARREVREETALELGKLRLIGVYSGPDALCEDLELDRAALEEKLSAAGFVYDEARNCFR